MKNNRQAIIYPVIILLLAAICSAVIYCVKTAKYEDWQTAEAVVVQRDALRKHSHRVCFTYTVDGVQYSGSEVWNDTADRNPVGSVTTVWYDPEQPSLVRYGKPSPGFDACAPFFLAVPLSIGVFLYNRRGERAVRL